jgi:DNA-binding NtrC family response regulator
MAQPIENTKETTGMGGGTIVIVDDTDYVREVIEMMLDRNDYKVYSFASAGDALAVCKNVKIDLFIIDVVMPEMSGIELLRRLNVRECFFEVIMITGKKDLKDATEAMDLGAFGILHKPFTYSEFLSAVERALASAVEKKHRIGNLMDQGQGIGNAGVQK